MGVTSTHDAVRKKGSAMCVACSMKKQVFYIQMAQLPFLQAKHGSPQYFYSGPEQINQKAVRYSNHHLSFSYLLGTGRRGGGAILNFAAKY